MALTGPDASRHQGDVDWRAVAAAGHDFAIIKATDGIRYAHVDWFRRNWPELLATGLVPGAYHFLLAHYHGAEQAQFYVSTVGSFDGVLAVVDVETGADGATPDVGRVREFAAEFRRLVPGHPLFVYTGKWYWDGILGDPHGVDIGPLWHSEYDTGREVDDGPELDNYGGWTGATIWQFTSSGSCPGITGRCDLNLFNGTRPQLASLASTDHEEDDMPYTPDQMVEFARKGATLALRKPGTDQSARQAVLELATRGSQAALREDISTAYTTVRRELRELVTLGADDTQIEEKLDELIAAFAAHEPDAPPAEPTQA